MMVRSWTAQARTRALTASALIAISFVLASVFNGVNAQAQSRPSDIVDVKTIEPSILVEMMYLTSDNFVGKPINGYRSNICFLTLDAAQALKKAQARLKAQGQMRNQSLSLLVRDCYRPKKAVEQFVAWAQDERATETKKSYYPDLPKQKLIADNYISPVSGHSRASSVDITIARVKPDGTHQSLPMGTIVDFFGERAHTAYAGISKEEIENRRLLSEVLSPEFKNYSKEWWHFALKTEPYPKTFFDFDVADSSKQTPQVEQSESVQTGAAQPEVVTQITQPQLLAELDRNNGSALSLANLFKNLHEANRLALPLINLAERSRGSELMKFEATYAQFAKVIKDDLSRLVSEMGIDWEKDITKTYSPAFAKTPAGKEHRQNGNVTRIFNEKWLTSKIGQFLLAGIVNRIDRKDFTPGTCGEVRFVYRLGYETDMKGETYASRIPFTINMVYTYKDDGIKCREVAKRWRLKSLADAEPVAASRLLLEGPIDFSRLTFTQMEVNAQVARFPSDLENVENRKFAGQAIYLMRIFGLKDGVFLPRKLENTPDVQAISKSSEKQKQLRDFISQNLRDIDTGVYLMPDALLADVAISFSTLGSARAANKPFDLLMTESDADAIVAKNVLPKSLRFALNGKGLLERLNMSTCMGCHQSSSTAGFHFLGTDRTDFGAKPLEIQQALDGNRLVLPFSPHLYAELPRRAKFVQDLATGIRPDQFRPHPSAPAANWTATGPTFKDASDNMPCPLKNDRSLAPSAQWSCDTSRGLTCAAVVTNQSQSVGLGQCIPQAEKIYSGLSCRKSSLAEATARVTRDQAKSPAAAPGLAFNVRSFQDRVTTDEQLYDLFDGKVDVSQYNCRPTRIGVPLGRVTKACTAAQMSLKGQAFHSVPDEICAVVGGRGFEEMAKGYFNSKKFAEGVGRGLLNTCSTTRSCREDYICQEMPDFLTGPRFNVNRETIKELRQKKIGFCTPTYFVYQLRLDGHPNPVD